jgi:large conductance mechanosensitive channel
MILSVVGLLTGGVDFTTKFIALNGESYANLDAAQNAGAAVITYGNGTKRLLIL